MKDLGDIFDEYEAELLAAEKIKIAAEDAAYQALSDEEKQKLEDEREKRYSELLKTVGESSEEGDSDEDLEDEDED